MNHSSRYFRVLFTVTSLVAFITGCSADDGAETEQVGGLSPEKRLVDQSSDSQEALTVLERAIDALGGEKILSRLKTGRAVFNVSSSNVPAFEKEMGRGDTRLEIHFDYPGHDRRFVRNRDGTQETLMITSNGTLWMRNSDGETSSTKSHTPDSYGGPMVLATIHHLIAVRDSGAQLRLDKSELSSQGHYILNVSQDGQPLSKLFIDSVSWHLLKNEKNSFKLDLSNLETSNPTTTTFGEYLLFDGIPFPKSVAVAQGQGKTVTVQLEEAEFLDTIDDNLFKIPM